MPVHEQFAREFDSMAEAAERKGHIKAAEAFRSYAEIYREDGENVPAERLAESFRELVQYNVDADANVTGA